MAAPHIPWISPDEFLDREERSETKHMYYAGSVTARAGGTPEHAFLAVNLMAELRAALRGRGCRVGNSDLMMRTGSEEMLTYPDVTVICGPLARMQGRPNVITNPIFVAEVLSPSAEQLDRGIKSRQYRATSSIKQYVLLSVTEPFLEIHTRGENGVWYLSEVSGLEAQCEFSSLDCRVPMAALYDGVISAE